MNTPITPAADLRKKEIKIAELREQILHLERERIVEFCDLKNENTRLREAAQAVVDRWETPLWKDVEPTAAVIYRLRDILSNVRDDLPRKAGGRGAGKEGVE